MRKTAVLLLLCFAAAARADVAAPRIANYVIDVRLDTAKKMLFGHERITWRNPSGDTIPELQFHLYLNAFRNDRSTFMRESGGRLRGDRADQKDPATRGWTEVKKMVVSGADVTSRIRFIHPDSPDADDRTVIAVALPAAVAPYGTAMIDVDFEAKLPKVFARTGYAGDFFMIGQWFPKIGVYEPTGLRHRASGGWNCHQFHADSEFYADYGDYLVDMTVPSEYIVGACGELLSKAKSGANTKYRYISRGVHDFAWTADKHFKVVRYTFDPTKDVPPAWTAEAARLLARPPDQLTLTPIDVTLLMQPGHDAAIPRYRASLNAAIAFCGVRYGRYPYPTLTLVDPPEDAHGASGMEYPGLFTGDVNAGILRWPFNGIRWPEIVTVHEFGHEYWYGMVGSNEFEESWLDEGINSFTEGEVMDKAYPRGSYVFPGDVGASDFATFRSRTIGASVIDPIVRPAWKFSTSRAYALNSYAKPALILKQMEGDLGEAVFARCLRAYFERYQFGHPDTQNFFEVFEQVSSRDLSKYKRAAFFGTQDFDLKIADTATKQQKGVWVSTARIERIGRMPAQGEVLFRFSNGHVERRTYPENATSVSYEFRYRAPMIETTVDPELKNIWDRELLDNSKLQKRTLAPAKLTVRAHSFVVQFLQELLWSLV